MKLLKIILLALCLSFNVNLHVKAQVFKNNGAVITVKEGSRVIINGNAENSRGKMLIERNGELRVYGDLTITSDTVLFKNSALGFVTGNMIVANSGVFYRNSGYLTVFGAIFNSGKLYNLGGIIEIGLP